MAHRLRIQRKRTKGWRKPEGAVSVCRPGMFGNPYRVGGTSSVHGWAPMSRTEAKEAFRRLLGPLPIVHTVSRELLERRAAILANLADLKGKQLLCFCKLTDPCHADVLAELANPEDE